MTWEEIPHIPVHFVQHHPKNKTDTVQTFTTNTKGKIDFVGQADYLQIDSAYHITRAD